MGLVAHYAGGIFSIYTSRQKPWTIEAMASPSSFRASGLMSLSRPAALFHLRDVMALFVSSSVGGVVFIGRSDSAGGGLVASISDVLFSRARKYSFRSLRRSCCLIGSLPSLFLTFTELCLFLSDRLWMILQVLCLPFLLLLRSRADLVDA